MDINKILQSNPKFAEKLAACKKNKKIKFQTKLAGKIGMAKSWAPFIAGSGLLAGTVAAGHISNVMEQSNKTKSFNKMMDLHKDKFKGENKMRILELYSTLWDFNKDIAKSPAAAASFIRDQLRIGDESLHLGVLSTLLSSRRGGGAGSMGEKLRTDAVKGIASGLTSGLLGIEPGRII